MMRNTRHWDWGVIRKENMTGSTETETSNWKELCSEFGITIPILQKTPLNLFNSKAASRSAS